MRSYDRLLFLFLAMVWMGLIFLLSSIPGGSLGPDHTVLNGIKKAGHFGLYGILGALYLFAIGGRPAERPAGTIAYLSSLVLAVLYAISDEYHQSFVPGRHAAATDVLIDACGAFAALSILHVRQTKQLMLSEGKNRYGQTADR